MRSVARGKSGCRSGDAYGRSKQYGTRTVNHVNPDRVIEKNTLTSRHTNTFRSWGCLLVEGCGANGWGIACSRAVRGACAGAAAESCVRHFRRSEWGRRRERRLALCMSPPCPQTATTVYTRGRAAIETSVRNSFRLRFGSGVTCYADREGATPAALRRSREANGQRIVGGASSAI